MASRFATVTSEEIIQINDEAVPENTKKATKFGLAVFKGNSLWLAYVLTKSLSMKSDEKAFVYKCKLILRNLISFHLFAFKPKLNDTFFQNGFKYKQNSKHLSKKCRQKN